MNKEALEQCLSKFPTAREVVVVGSPRLIAKIVAERWNGIDEAERQNEIWKFLEVHFGKNVYAGIEFIHTNAPADRRD